MKSAVSAWSFQRLIGKGEHTHFSIIEKAKEFESEIVIAKGEKSANAKKLIALMGLAIKQGERISVKISGDDEEKAAAEMEKTLMEIL